MKTRPTFRTTNSTSFVPGGISFTGTFYVFRELKKYTVFLSTTEPAIAYGVLALFATVRGLDRAVPAAADADGPVAVQGQDRLRRLDEQLQHFVRPRHPAKSECEDFKEAKARHGIVTSLPMSDKPLPRKAPKPKPVPKPPSREEKDEVLGVVIGLIDQFCKEHLNEEYAVLCRKLAEKLARKRPSPLLHGSPNAWASGIVRAVGGVNFLHDKSQTPYMRSTDIDHYLGTSPSSGAAKLAAIRKMFKMHQLDPNWTLPSRLEDNPMVWMLQVNGFMVDVRHAPREVQEIAFNKGLIPYIPADRQ